MGKLYILGGNFYNDFSQPPPNFPKNGGYEQQQQPQNNFNRQGGGKFGSIFQISFVKMSEFF